MLRSLVGSEMCIRDRLCALTRLLQRLLPSSLDRADRGCRAPPVARCGKSPALSRLTWRSLRLPWPLPSINTPIPVLHNGFFVFCTFRVVAFLGQVASVRGTRSSRSSARISWCVLWDCRRGSFVGSFTKTRRKKSQEVRTVGDEQQEAWRGVGRRERVRHAGSEKNRNGGRPNK